MSKLSQDSQTERVPIAEPSIGTGEKERVLDLLDQGRLAAGDEVSRFEDAFSSYCSTAHGVATANGTAALHAALEALGIGEGDTVVTTPFSFVATANAIRFAGATPVFADIDPETFNLDPDSVESVIRDSDGDVDAVLVVHLYGLPAEMDRFQELADSYDLALIEDAAQAHGATYRDKPVGSLGDVGCFSFYPTKNMTTGEGGMVVTDSADVAERARRFVDHGRADHGYEHVDVGHNFRMTELAAAIGLEQLRSLQEFVRTRRQNAAELTSTINTTQFTPPIESAHTQHAFHQYTMRCQNRDDFVDFLDDFGVQTGVYYRTPIHKQPAYEGWTNSLPEAERAAAEVVSLPVHPELSEQDLRTIKTALTYFDAYKMEALSDC